MTNNQLAENSVIQLLNSVKLARDNAERADNRVDHSFYYALTIALEELQERRKAAMDSEQDCNERQLFCSTDTARMRKVISASAGTEDAPLYRHAQPASERDQVRSAHAEWSQATFGNVGPVGPLKHLSKEALEAAAEPGDLSEWADMQFLLWDAQRRAGITDEQITQAMIEKLAVNKQRKWPEPKDGEPRLHIKEQPAPVVLVIPDEMTSGQAYEIGYYYGDPVDVFARGANWMRQHIIDSTLAAAPQSHGSEPATVPGKWIQVSERMPEIRKGWLDTSVIIAVLGEKDGAEAMYCSDGKFRWGRDEQPIDDVTHWMPLPAAPQEVK
ncbi:dATP/dGTP pyrophosphohydrolase domain-containing protein [Klebsiella pneumoniae]|uniref:dATP/dGTP pyrophosphohydrolase domain-containing protein n=3 Tax=Klebsiella pneumoniae TaxID=573 RepID=UPI0013EFB929|nr:dATP/dGTP pyrophosphohydrolase domain-containing protein [Klebsiella pneumoniae]